MKKYIYGEIDGIKSGDIFKNRREIYDAGLHGSLQAGISGNQVTGSDAIVISGGYIDDLDLGEAIIYTGQGGRDEKTGRQVANQELVRGNAAIVTSCDLKIPIRVIRGSKSNSVFAPKEGYRYDGLYYCARYWATFSVDGPLIWRFLLIHGEIKNSQFPNNEDIDL